MPSIAASLLIIRDNAFLESFWNPALQCTELRFDERMRRSVRSFVEQVVGGEDTGNGRFKLTGLTEFCSI
ncbi:hypothetical protein V6N11_006592 [Hibiscus sabdariffa]|uniref:Uncharacterized protein n=1 Tax=Hibiscus sabdariffa TaxID=183260 RepID=A0ABR2RS33_9ROSI